MWADCSSLHVWLPILDNITQLGHQYYQVIISFIKKIYLHSTSKSTPILYSMYDCVPTLKIINTNTQLEDNYLIFVIVNITNLNLYLSITPLSLCY